jgi:hypothetical protein
LAKWQQPSWGKGSRRTPRVRAVGCSPRLPTLSPRWPYASAIATGGGSSGHGIGGKAALATREGTGRFPLAPTSWPSCPLWRVAGCLFVPMGSTTRRAVRRLAPCFYRPSRPPRARLRTTPVRCDIPGNSQGGAAGQRWFWHPCWGSLRSRPSRPTSSRARRSWAGDLTARPGGSGLGHSSASMPPRR